MPTARFNNLRIIDENKWYYRSSLILSSVMMFMELVTGLWFSTHSLIIDSIFRLFEMSSSMTLLQYFVEHQQNISEHFVTKAAKINLTISSIQIIGGAAGLLYSIVSLLKDSPLHRIPQTLPETIVLGICVLFTGINIQIYR